MEFSMNTGVGSLSLLQRNLPNPGIEPRSPALQVDFLPAEPQGKPKNTGVGGLSLLQGIFPTQGLTQGSPALQADSLPTKLSGKPNLDKQNYKNPELPQATLHPSPTQVTYSLTSR